MSPSSFTFKLSVPNDPELTIVVADMARHAAEYANLANGAADGFIERTRSAAAKALRGPVDRSTPVVFSAEDGTLTAVVGSETITAPLP
jgi:hypothetical protein